MLNFVSIALIVLSASTLMCSAMVSYENYMVFRIIPKNNMHIEVLRQLDMKKGYSFWIEPGLPGKRVDLQIAPTQVDEFIQEMKSVGMHFKLTIRNLQDLINQQLTTTEPRAGGSVFDFSIYHELKEIYNWMNMLVLVHPRNVEIIVSGQSYAGRQIKGVRLRFGPPKPGIFIEGGMHPREWISPATVVYLIDQLLNSKVPEVRRLAESYEWYILPVCNPDGYVYTHKEDRMWRKSLSDTGAGRHPLDPDCKGVDLNRNFGYMWEELASTRINDPCHERFAGREAFSEPETRSLSQFIESLGGKLFAYLSFHSYSQLLLIPYCHTSQHLDNYADAFSIGTQAVGALFGKYSTRYEIGTIAELLYSSSGTSMDWVKGALKLDLVYTYKMRDNNGFYGFLIPPQLIIPNGEEVLDSLVAMFQEANRLGYPRTKKSCFGPSGSKSGRSSAPGSGPGECSGSKGKGIFKFKGCFSG